MSQQIIEIEELVIGSLIIEPSKFMDIDLVSDDFLTEQNRIIYSTICEMNVSNDPIDTMTVSDRLSSETGKQWMPIIARIAYAVTSTANVRTYAGLVRKYATERKARVIASKLIESASEPGAVDGAIGELMRLNVSRKNFEHSITDAIRKAVDVIDEAFQCEGYPGVPMGMHDIDQCLGGLHRSDLVIIGARPSAGKTAFMLNIADRCGVPAGICSGEQAHEQIGARMISMNGKVSAHKMRLAKELDASDWTGITAGVSKLQNREIWINDQPAPTIEQIIRQARQWKHQRGIKILLIDYIQRIKAKAPTKREEVGLIAQSLKELARELDIPVVCLAQVNRSVDQRADKNPLMSDLKEAGEIEQEADVVMTLYRDDMYNQDSDEKGIMRVNICKNRHGPTGTVRLIWLAEYMTVQSHESRNYE